MLQKAYGVLEARVPSWMKQVIPQRWRIWLGYQIKAVRRQETDHFQQLTHPLVLPAGETEQSLFEFLSGYQETDELANRERRRYLRIAFRRFLYTLHILPPGSGSLLEIGSHPYFISLLLGRFTNYQLKHINFFGSAYPSSSTQRLIGPDGGPVEFEFDNVNIEAEPFPYEDNAFDAVILCEVLEHLANDPQRALLEIKRVLKSDGIFILTTPNAARSENVARLLGGENVYDQYSGYGPYGRHNREYTVEEIRDLLEHLDYEIDELFTSDIGTNQADNYFKADRYKRMIWDRKDSLGEYIFLRARNGGETRNYRKPRWLYRSYPVEEMEGD